MSSNLKTSVIGRNVQLAALGEMANGGFLRIYSGDQPFSPQHGPLSSNVCLCELRLNRTAFGKPDNAMIRALPIMDDLNARAGGKATWYRVLQNDGITALWDGSVGLAPKNPEDKNRPDLVFNDVNIQAHAKVTVTDFTYSIPQ